MTELTDFLTENFARDFVISERDQILEGWKDQVINSSKRVLISAGVNDPTDGQVIRFLRSITEHLDSGSPWDSKGLNTIAKRLAEDKFMKSVEVVQRIMKDKS